MQSVIIVVPGGTLQVMVFPFLLHGCTSFVLYVPAPGETKALHLLGLLVPKETDMEPGGWLSHDTFTPKPLLVHTWVPTSLLSHMLAT